ncbi:MAG: hypothetical protein IPK83_16050 [Planctomycetes bacterium]|nr:hypothetical protein [Planctomycetota bacterium]
MAALTIPLLIHLEWRTGGNFLGEAGRDFAKDSAWDGLAMLGLPFGSPALAIAAANPRAATAGFMELFLIGPRLLVPGVRHLALAARLRMVDTVRAARVMEEIADSVVRNGDEIAAGGLGAAPGSRLYHLLAGRARR